jgi:hypothetical protein
MHCTQMAEKEEKVVKREREREIGERARAKRERGERKKERHRWMDSKFARNGIFSASGWKLYYYRGAGGFAKVTKRFANAIWTKNYF